MPAAVALDKRSVPSYGIAAGDSCHLFQHSTCDGPATPSTPAPSGVAVALTQRAQSDGDSSASASAACAELCTPSRRKYRLVRLDEATGRPVRPVTDEEALDLERLFSEVPLKTDLSPAVIPILGSHLTSKRDEAQFSANRRLASPHHQKPGGPCDHCGASESPQWRRGPNHKPVLCNACGTRFRRTHQLGPPIPSTGKGANKREASPTEPEFRKQARVQVLLACGS